MPINPTDGFRFEVTGLKELDRAVRRLDSKTRGTALKKAMRAAGKIILDDARARVPVRSDGREKPGRGPGFLRKNIRVSITANRRQVRARIRHTKDAFYGRFLELGSSHQSARPFLRPALDRKGPEALARFEALLRQQIIGGLR